jgi:hypothetical protein
MTPTEIKHEALRKLKVISAEEFASAADYQLMTRKYLGVHAMILEMELVIWAVTENIPSKCEQPMIAILCAHSADEFGVKEPRATLLKGEGMLGLPAASPAERLLRKVLTPTIVKSQVRADYF